MFMPLQKVYFRGILYVIVRKSKQMKIPVSGTKKEKELLLCIVSFEANDLTLQETETPARILECNPYICARYTSLGEEALL